MLCQQNIDTFVDELHVHTYRYMVTSLETEAAV